MASNFSPSPHHLKYKNKGKPKKLSFGQGGTNARRCEEKEVVLEETRL